jgi:hypothetical protein
MHAGQKRHMHVQIAPVWLTGMRFRSVAMAATIGWLHALHTRESVTGRRPDSAHPDSHAPVMADEIEGPHLHPQPDQQRTAVPGRRARVSVDGASLADGGTTLLAIRWQRAGHSDGWVFYLDTDPKRAIFITDTDLAPFIAALVKR